MAYPTSTPGTIHIDPTLPILKITVNYDTDMATVTYDERGTIKTMEITFIWETINLFKTQLGVEMRKEAL